MSSRRVRTYNKISSLGLDILTQSGYTVDGEIEGAEGIVLRSHKLAPEQIEDTVLAVARAGAGVNNIPVDHCTGRGVVVFNTPGANANSVKELVITGLLLSSRKIVEGIEWVRSLGDADDVSARVEKAKSGFAGPEIAGKTLGVVGLGAIGVMVANAASALGMNVIGYDPYISVASAWGLSRAVGRAHDLNELFAASDYVTLHAPLLDSTKNMINKDSISQMKTGARLLNFARGGLVNDSDVAAALDSGALSAYVTDFPSATLSSHDKVVPVPHLGASTPEAEDNCAVMAARQLQDYLETGNIENSVNFPSCNMRPSGAYRLVVANRNIPNMVGQYTTILARHGYNILDLLNRHKDEVAYNVIDLQEEMAQAVIDEISAIDGVIMARYLGKV